MACIDQFPGPHNDNGLAPTLRFRLPEGVTLDELAILPRLVAQLQADVAELRQRLVVAERRPYTVGQAAQALGVDPKTVRRRIDRGEIQHERVGRRVVVYLAS